VEDDLTLSPDHEITEIAVWQLTIPAHRPIKRSTLSHILKQARLSIDRFLELV
jgi:hypothetical protein